VADELERLASGFGGLVDDGTWGHCRWERAAENRNFCAGFGSEFRPITEDETDRSLPRPVAWALAKSPSDFYQWMSEGDFSLDSIAEAREHSFIFAGCALTDPETFDFIDINPASPLATQTSLALARATGKSVVITSDNDYPALKHRSEFLAITGGSKMTPQHLLTMEEAERHLRRFFLSDEEWNQAIKTTQAVANRLRHITLAKAPMIHFEGDLHQLVEDGRQNRLNKQHIKEWTPTYQQRLEKELSIIGEKKFESYFLVVSDLVRWAKERMLVGPARGSSAGSLVCYLLDITEVDPLIHGLIFERFIDVNRADLPDIDIDFSDKRRYMVFDYLAEKYGRDYVARLGNISRLKPRSVMAETGKRLGIPAYETFPVRNVLIEYSSGDSRFGKGLEDTLENTEPGKDFVKRYPESLVMRAAENHAWHTSVHAAGVLVSNEPVTQFCTVRDGIAQLDKPDAEYLNLLKIDALGLRTLGVIEDAGCVDSELLFGLKMDDPKVFQVFNDKRFAGLFQFEGAAQRRVSVQIPVTSFKQIDHITALARPGPLGGGAANTYINRNAGTEETKHLHPSMEGYLKETHGVVLYQEQVMTIVREMGEFSWAETSAIRKAMSGRKGIEHFSRQKKDFVQGTSRLGIDEKTAGVIWEQICSFGAWGMNKSHTVSYAIISYWCAYMKAYHPLQFAAALLRNAKDDDQVIEMLRELRDEGISYTAFDPKGPLVEDWTALGGRLVGGLKNIHGVGPAKAKQIIARAEAEKSTPKDLALMNGGKLKFESLTPTHDRWSDIFNDPAKYRIVNSQLKEFGDLKDFEVATVICKIIRKERRDENETVRLNRRGGKPYAKGQSLFLDIFAVDDTTSKPVLLRVKTHRWHDIGIPLADYLIDDEDWVLVKGKWLANFSMLLIDKIRVLTQPDFFNKWRKRDDD